MSYRRSLSLPEMAVVVDLVSIKVDQEDHLLCTFKFTRLARTGQGHK
jgi:hypothetical protein